jgi:nucleoid-associated protein YgaU
VPSSPVPTQSAATPDSSIPTLVAEPIGGPDSGRFASGKAIIRHGDNLWTIAKRVYGFGMRYTTIYQANNDQIRNPSLIYPGQIFDLPKQKAGG